MKNKILVIEDDRAISELLCMNLEAAGYETVAAYDGEEAQRLLLWQEDADLALEFRRVLFRSALMESLLVNLIDNALKATVAGGSIWVKAYEKAGKKIFEVSDTGMGIPEEELGKITDAFYMVDKSRSRKEGGSGLGLALCVKVAEIHGGCLKIESRQREGTTVRAIF